VKNMPTSAAKPAPDKAFEAASQAAQPVWFAVRIRSRHEKVATDQLRRQGIETYLPLMTQVHQWSDRKKQVEIPLFAGYAFVRFEPASDDRFRVLKTHGVVGFVGPNWQQTPVPDVQISNIRSLLTADVPAAEHPYLMAGQRVRIRGGALNGVEGILSSLNGDRSLVITVEPIARSISIRVEGYEVDVI
jgi:transcription antitermination factor NusG